MKVNRNEKIYIAPCKKKLSLDFVAGLIVGGGCFTWVKQNKTEAPSFQMTMHWRDTELIETVRDSLGLPENVHVYLQAGGRKKALLFVRRRESLENIIIPAFENRLMGYKKVQFNAWRKKFFEHKKTWKSAHKLHIKDALAKMNIPFYSE